METRKKVPIFIKTNDHVFNIYTNDSIDKIKDYFYKGYLDVYYKDGTIRRVLKNSIIFIDYEIKDISENVDVPF